jgi:hypothetical protein
VTAVPHAKRTPERLSAFSDGVFAVLITVLVQGRKGWAALSFNFLTRDRRTLGRSLPGAR